MGSVIKGTSGIRKIRVSNSAQKTGKSGGSRVIYLFVDEADRIYFLAIFSKAVKEDLTPDQRKLLAKLADELKRTTKRGSK